jgi:acyl-[acyl-carrier-protein]-phospholipid O-acyltransferase/long-chain-fatty-acid--[acyl-carrier-protein] ligase
MKSTHRNWFYLFLTNFLGVFNDNFLKHCMVFVSVTWALPRWMTQSQLISIVAAALVVPYLLVSPLAGSLAFRYSKQRIWRWLKLLELPVMALASVAFLYEWVWLAVVAVVLMGILSALYSPSKYGLIRDVEGPDRVSFGSGVFETMSFLGILLGSVTAPLLSDHYRVWIPVTVFMGIGVLGLLTSLRLKVDELPEEDEPSGSVHPIRFFKEAYALARQYPHLNAAVLGSSIFWMVGGMIQMNVVIYCTHRLHTTNTMAGLVLCGAAIGIALGCSVAGLWSGKRVRTGLIPVGLIGMMVCLLGLLFMQSSVAVTAGLVFGLAFMGGFFEVPCMALVQHAPLGRKLGKMIAYLNFVNFVCILLGTGLFSVTTSLAGQDGRAVFGVIFGCCALTLLYYLIFHPKMLTGKAVIE